MSTRKSLIISHHIFETVEDGFDIYEIWLEGDHWAYWNMTASIGAAPAAGGPMGYQGGGTARVVYQGTDQHIHEIWLAGDHWEYWNMTASIGAPPARGRPMGYQGGGTARVVYQDTDQHIHEISLAGNRWVHYAII